MRSFEALHNAGKNRFERQHLTYLGKGVEPVPSFIAKVERIEHRRLEFAGRGVTKIFKALGGEYTCSLPKSFTFITTI